MIQLYNTLTRQKEQFLPINPGVVNMYVCGPTVYNYIHIGNARSAIAFDTIRRYFEYRGYKVNYVSNFTDVDDKIIRAAKENNTTPQELANTYIAAFKEDAAALNIEPATLNPRVMDHMDDIIAFITGLIEKGFAYASAGDVYFRTRKFPEYGRLSGQSIDELEVGASLRTGAEQKQKEDPLDFALWKAAKPDEIFWEAPFGPGRPGWHIECSVMAVKHLGPTIDIHGGGQDLEFPHHENEIAQSESETGKTFANYWMHNAFVTVGEEDEKMSKSLNNFVTVHELIQNVAPQVVRFFMATTQYRRPIRFTTANLEEAKTNLQKLRTTFDNIQFRKKDTVEMLFEETMDDLKIIDGYQNKFQEAMDDDFNAANGITVVYEFAKFLNAYVARKVVAKEIIDRSLEFFADELQVFGIEFQAEGLLDSEVEALIEERNQARKNRDFARSDEIRNQFLAQGIILEDTAQGTRWRRDHE